MYFLQWLGKRAWTSMISKWDWIYEYRKLILEIFPLAAIITVLVGAIWFIGSALVVTWICGNEVPPRWALYCLIAMPVLFFVYNWLAALHEIYEHEKQRVLDRLKGQYD